jgi:hypothetical protein
VTTQAWSEETSGVYFRKLEIRPTFIMDFNRVASWTKEKIARLSDSEIESLRSNAAKVDRLDVVAMCNDELEHRRSPRTGSSSKEISDGHNNEYVSEFHFVCPNELGVEREKDGMVWTGTWVVAEEHAENALKYGAIVALHTSKTEPSYLQGTIKDWRKRRREPRYSGEQPTRIEQGIDFLFEPGGPALQWAGDGSGEKGYAWAALPG